MSISFTKVAVLQPEKRLHQRWFPVVSLIFQNSFLPKHVWMVTASVKYHLFFFVALTSSAVSAGMDASLRGFMQRLRDISKKADLQDISREID